MWYIPMIIILGGGTLLAFYMKKRMDNAQANSTLDMNEERQKHAQYRDELLNDQYDFLKDVVDGPIDSFSMVTKPESMGAKVAKETLNYLKRSAARRFTYQRIQTLPDSYFGALSGDDLHIVRYDQHGDLKDHLVFGPERLSNAKLEDQGKAKVGSILFTEAASASQPNVSLITFNVDGKPMSYEIYDRIPQLTGGTAAFNTTLLIQNRAKEQVIGERLLQDLKSKYPNLATPVASGSLAEV